MTFNSRKDASIPLQVHHISKLVDSSDCIVALEVTFGNFKHNYNQPPFLLVYLSLQGNRPVPRNLFADLLSISLKACGLDSTCYKGHSFRIGAASFAAERVCLMLRLGCRATGSQMPSSSISEYFHR